MRDKQKKCNGEFLVFHNFNDKGICLPISGFNGYVQFSMSRLARLGLIEWFLFVLTLRLRYGELHSLQVHPMSKSLLFK